MSLSNGDSKIKNLDIKIGELQEMIDKEDFESISLSMLSIISDGIIAQYDEIQELRKKVNRLCEILPERIYITSDGERIELEGDDCISKVVESKPDKED